MPRLDRSIFEARDLVRRLDRRRAEASQVWKDYQWDRFNSECLEEIRTSLNGNQKLIEELDSQLALAIKLLKNSGTGFDI